MKNETTKRPGRPKEFGATVPLQIRLTPEQHAWIKSQPESASEIVRRWIDAAMKQNN